MQPQFVLRILQLFLHQIYIVMTLATSLKWLTIERLTLDVRSLATPIVTRQGSSPATTLQVTSRTIEFTSAVNQLPDASTEETPRTRLSAMSMNLLTLTKYTKNCSRLALSSH